MTIKGRLILSYTAMLVVPILLLGITGWVVGASYRQDNLQRQGWNPRFHLAPLELSGGVRELNLKILENPDNLIEPSFWQAFEREYSSWVAGVAVRKSHRLIYISDRANESRWAENLPGFGSSIHARALRHSPQQPFQWDFYFSDGSEGSLFIFANQSAFGSDSSPRNIIFLLITVSVLIATNGVLTFLVSRSILRPLSSLKQAAERIKEGDLGSPMERGSNDEFGEVVTAFEEMRARLKESLERQLQYEESRRELVANISHDLRTPITAIKGYVEGIRDGVADSPKKVERYLDTIYSKAIVLDRLIEELFFYSRLDLKSVAFDFVELPLGPFLKESLEELVSDYDDVAVRYIGAGDCEITVLVDRIQLRRVFANLVENGVKYNDKGHTDIQVRSRKSGETVTLEFQDNGPGIDADLLPHIFDRFFRADRSRVAVSEGSGLGLAIARQIIEAHGGRIWARSSPGSGTTICFTLRTAESRVKQ